MKKIIMMIMIIMIITIIVIIVGAGGDPFASPYGKTNTINYVQIMTQGNANDFGDLTIARNHMGAATNGHGGL